MPLPPAAQPGPEGKDQASWREEGPAVPNVLGTWQVEGEQDVTWAVTGEGTRGQTHSLPSTPWVRVRPGVLSRLGHPAMETAMQRGHSCGCR